MAIAQQAARWRYGPGSLHSVHRCPLPGGMCLRCMHPGAIARLQGCGRRWRRAGRAATAGRLLRASQVSAGCGQRQVQVPPLPLPTYVQHASPCLSRRALFFNTGRVQSSRLPQKMGLQSDDVSQPAAPAELIFCSSACSAFSSSPHWRHDWRTCTLPRMGPGRACCLSPLACMPQM